MLPISQPALTGGLPSIATAPIPCWNSGSVPDAGLPQVRDITPWRYEMDTQITYEISGKSQHRLHATVKYRESAAPPPANTSVFLVNENETALAQKLAHE